jgi:hypothetical protein
MPGVAAAQSVTASTALFLVGATAPGAAGPGADSLLALVVIPALAAGVFMALDKLVALRQTREHERLLLQATVVHALLREREPVIPTIHVPLWSGSPVTIEVTGYVASASQRQAAVRLVADAAAQVRPDVAIRNRLILVQAPEPGRRAA